MSVKNFVEKFENEKIYQFGSFESELESIILADVLYESDVKGPTAHKKIECLPKDMIESAVTYFYGRMPSTIRILRRTSHLDCIVQVWCFIIEQELFTLMLDDEYDEDERITKYLDMILPYRIKVGNGRCLHHKYLPILWAYEQMNTNEYNSLLDNNIKYIVMMESLFSFFINKFESSVEHFYPEIQSKLKLDKKTINFHLLMLSKNPFDDDMPKVELKFKD